MNRTRKNRVELQAGPDGAILVEDAPGTTTDREYVDGVRWNEGFVSSFLLRPEEATTSRVLNPRVLITDYALERAEQLVPALEACVGAGDRSLLVVAPEVRDALPPSVTGETAEQGGRNDGLNA